MSCDASGRAYTKEREKIFFMIKKIKIEKHKSKDQRTKSDVHSKNFQNLLSFFFGFLF